MYELTWADLVRMLQSAWNTVIDNALRLLQLFLTPFGEILNNDVGASSWITDLIQWILSFFGVNFLLLTPLEFMLGSAIPLIIVFTIYRYVKQ